MYYSNTEQDKLEYDMALVADSYRQTSASYFSNPTADERRSRHTSG